MAACISAGPRKLRDHHGDWHQAWLCSKEQGGHQSHQWQGGVFSKKCGILRVFLGAINAGMLWLCWWNHHFEWFDSSVLSISNRKFLWDLVLHIMIGKWSVRMRDTLRLGQGQVWVPESLGMAEDLGMAGFNVALWWPLIHWFIIFLLPNCVFSWAPFLSQQD